MKSLNPSKNCEPDSTIENEFLFFSVDLVEIASLLCNESGLVGVVPGVACGMLPGVAVVVPSLVACLLIPLLP